MWVTDFVSKSNLKDLFNSQPGVAASVKSVFSQVGRDVVPDNPFEFDDCINRWLDQFGLVAQATVALKDATGILKLESEVPAQQRQRIVGNRKIWRVVPGSGS